MNLLRRILLVIGLVASLGSHAVARDANYERAQTEFRAKNYDAAITYFRKYLRKFSTDYDTWSLLGASYYHAGQPPRGLTNLKKVERRVTQRSYNFYYQGLCYLSVGRMPNAKRYLAYAARYADEYAGRATFELALAEYNSHNKDGATYWVEQYLRRFPAGNYTAEAQRMAKSLREDTYLTDIKGDEKPDVEAALFRYSKYSLMDRPHFWFFQTGYGYEQGSTNNPRFGRGNIVEVKAEGYAKHVLKINTGLAVGPYKANDSEAYFGYNYFQDWNTDQDRLNDWFSDFSDFGAFPFRPDLLERKHQLFADFTKAFSPSIYAGVTGRFELIRVGSALFAADESADIKRVLNVATVTLLVPWVGYRYGDHETDFYAYLRKELNDESPELSNKSYSLQLSDEEKVFSYGITQKLRFPDIRTKIDAELFHYEFIYNDYWLDYTRQGIILGAEHEFIPTFYVDANVGTYEDRYQFPHIRLGACKFGEEPPADSGLVSCPRTDTGLFYQLGVAWRWSQFDRLSGYYRYVQNSNPTLKVFDETKTEFVAMYTFAFPSIDRVRPFIERFGDAAITKEAE